MFLGIRKLLPTTLFGLIVALAGVITYALFVAKPPCNLGSSVAHFHSQIAFVGVVALAFAAIGVFGPEPQPAERVRAAGLARRLWRLAAALIGWIASIALILEVIGNRATVAKLMAASVVGPAVFALALTAVLWFLPTAVSTMVRKRSGRISAAPRPCTSPGRRP